MTTKPTCGRCSQPAPDNAQLCHRCTSRLTKDLAEIPALAGEIETTRLRQCRTGGQPIGGGHTSERPLPWDDRPVQAARALSRVLFDVTMLVVDQRGTPWPRDTLTDMARFLLAQVPWLRHREEAPGLYDQLVQAIARVRSTVDRRAERIYAGPCGAVEYDDTTGQPKPDAPACPADLYARPGRKTVVCEACRAEHDVQERREWMLEAAQDTLVTATELSRFLTVYGDHVTPQRIYMWAERGRLEVHGSRPAVGERKPAQLFRVRDARELLEELGRQQSTRTG